LLERPIYYQPYDVWILGGKDAFMAAVANNRVGVVKILPDPRVSNRSVVGSRNFLIAEPQWMAHTGRGTAEKILFGCFQGCEYFGRYRREGGAYTIGFPESVLCDTGQYATQHFSPIKMETWISLPVLSLSTARQQASTFIIHSSHSVNNFCIACSFYHATVKRLIVSGRGIAQTAKTRSADYEAPIGLGPKAES